MFTLALLTCAASAASSSSARPMAGLAGSVARARSMTSTPPYSVGSASSAFR